MPSNFKRSIRSAIEDQTLQAALDLNAQRRMQGRLAAMATLDDPQAARRMAHAVRAETIANLETYLEQFVQKAEANGMIVHRVADAQEANSAILQIIRSHGASLVAKSKSMVSEEIELNHALEAAGIRSVETDLGEYIVQLRREKPSHIITPAVHLTRRQVSETFERELGAPPTTEIADLTAIARRELRRVFLTAGVGISGVNFGIAESGSLCIVTNEGNGRMVTSLPPVHIALMGIERLVRNWDDLSLMLSLLPRSATGQKITVYTNLIRGPRPADEADGARERHLILVDNGRLALRASPLAESLLCIRCGACLNACPVFREIGGHAYVGRSGAATPYPGPIGSIVAPGLFGQSEFGHLARASTLCGACREACPVDIDLPKLLLRTRVGGRGGETREGTAPKRFSRPLQIYTWLATDSRRFQVTMRLASRLAPLFSPRSRWMRLPAFTGWGVSRRFPRPVEPFSVRYKQIKNQGISESANRRFGDSATQRNLGSPKQRKIDSVNHRIAESPSLQTDKTELVERFRGELEALGGVFELCTPAELSGAISALLRERDIHSLFAWESDQLPDGLLHSLKADGFELYHERSGDPQAHLVSENSAGLTGAQAAIAQTGTLVTVAAPGRPLSTSLLPEIHIAVLRAEDIYESLPQVLALQDLREASSAVLISGPSRTADIEMTLTVGVHGPREVIVFCTSGA